MNNKKLKNQFEKVKRLSQKKHEEGHKLDLMIEERWGFSYSDEDLEEIIDTLDYGTSDIPFKRFTELMDNPKIRFQERKDANCEGDENEL